MRRQTFNEINITPLTDIFLVLLIIMMVIAPMLDQQGMKLTIPEFIEQQDKKADDAKILTVTVDENNNYLIDDTIVSENDIIQEVKKYNEFKESGMMIEVAGDSKHGSVVKLMDIARNWGMHSISVTQI